MRGLNLSVETKQSAPVWGVALALVLIAKAPTLSTPYYWDEVGWANGALWLAEGDLLRAMPGSYPAATFMGHPPGLHFALAALFKLFGRSIIVAHLLIAGFATVGLVFTYQLGRWLYGPIAGLLGALFLFAMPVYFAQAGMFLADLPVAAVGTASVYLALRRRWGAYFACAAYLLLLKETAMAVVVALVLYVVVTSTGGLRERAQAALVWAAPLLCIGLFLAAQRVATGHWVFIIDEPVALVEAGLPEVFGRIVRISRWLFVDQARYLCTAVCLLALLVRGVSWWRRELLLFVLIAVMGAFPFAGIYFLPRYVLPVLPYLCIASTGALVCLVPWRSAQLLLGVLVAAAMHASPMIVPDSNHEWNMRYRAVIHVYRSAYASLQRARQGAAGGACVLTVWPHTVQLARPELGYVDAPIPAVAFAAGAPEAEPGCELILVSWPGHRDAAALREYARRHGFILSDRIASGEIVAEQYRRTRLSVAVRRASAATAGAFGHIEGGENGT